MRRFGPCLVVRLFLAFCLCLICFSGCDSGDRQPPTKKIQTEETGGRTSSSPEKKRVLFVNSYHRGYQWSDGIGNAICQFFHIPASDIAANNEAVGDVLLKIVYMDSKRQQSETYLQKKGLEVKKLIEAWQPDVVITSDDNAAKYVIVPYFKGDAIPFVFCGINWDCSEYGLPTINVTGILEVQLIDELLKYLRALAAGPRIGFLKGDDRSARKEAEFYEQRFNIDLDKRFVTNFTEWRQQYLALQEEVDLLLLGNAASIRDWDSVAAKKLVNEHSRIPSGNWDVWMAPYALITFATKPEEQGTWAAKTASKILSGKSPASIPVTQNVVAHVVLNMELAKRMGVKLPVSLIEHAEFVGNIQ